MLMGDDPGAWKFENEDREGVSLKQQVLGQAVIFVAGEDEGAPCHGFCAPIKGKGEGGCGKTEVGGRVEKEYRQETE